MLCLRFKLLSPSLHGHGLKQHEAPLIPALEGTLTDRVLASAPPRHHRRSPGPSRILDGTCSSGPYSRVSARLPALRVSSPTTSLVTAENLGATRGQLKPNSFGTQNAGWYALRIAMGKLHPESRGHADTSQEQILDFDVLISRMEREKGGPPNQTPTSAPSAKDPLAGARFRASGSFPPLG